MEKKDGSGLCNPPRSLQSQHSTRSQLHHRRGIPPAACPGHGTQGSSHPCTAMDLPLQFPALSTSSSTALRRASPEQTWQTTPATALGAPKCSLSCQETMLGEYCYLPQSITSGFAFLSFVKKQKITLILVKYNFLNSENHTKRSRLQIDGI